MNTSTPETTYIERSDAMTAQERTELRAVLSDKAAELAKLIGTKQFSEKRIVNVAREIGQQIELFTGREKLAPGAFQSLAPALHTALPDAHLEFAKRCVALHHRFPEPVTDALVAANECQELMVQLQLLPRGVREAARSEAIKEPIKDVLSSIIRSKSETQELLKKCPLKDWPPFMLDTLIREGTPLADTVVAARHLRAGTVDV